MGNEKFLSDIRNALGALTEADPYFADIPVITERLKSIQGRIDQIVGTAGGIALVLVTPIVGGVLANVPGANFTGIKVIGRVLENTKRNQTGKEALDIAIYTAALWSQLRPDALSSALRPDEPTILLANDPKFLSYDVAFSTEGGTKIDIPTLDAPVLDISNPAAAVLSNTQPGAAMFYTLDGSPPFPRNPSAHLYIAPFNANPPGTKLRARVWLAGYQPSAETIHTT
jgi:hypothetical protein